MEVPRNIVAEKRREGSVIHFEPGIHPPASELTQLYKDFNNGHLETQMWNKEVSERIASYAYNAPALLLTIDGLAPEPPSANPLFNSLQEAIYTWVRLPSRPNKLNHTHKAYVVKGDSQYYRLPQAVLHNIEEPESLRQQMEAQAQNEAENAQKLDQNAIMGETAGIAALGMALWGASKLLSPAALSQRMSRRKFLGRSLAITTGVMVGGSLLRLETPNIANVPNEPTEEFLQTVANVVRPRLARPIFQDGRTALLLAKAEDAQASLPELFQATNVVVMGSGHLDMASRYMQDNGERNKSIAAYATELLDVAKQVYGNYYRVSPDQITPQATNALLNYVTQVDIVAVTDPGGSSFQPSLAQIIDKQITPYKSFYSPRVAEAIKDLRPTVNSR